MHTTIGNMQRLNIYAGATLYETPSKLFIQPRDALEEALVVNRQTGEISHNEMFSTDFMPSNTKAQHIYGVMGIKHLINSSYLIVITSATNVGNLSGHEVHKVETTRLIPIRSIAMSATTNTAKQLEWEARYLAMLESILQTPSFYFSYTYDLTNSLQRNYAIAADLQPQEAYNHCDKRFLWNDHLLADFDRFNTKVARYLSIIILGFVDINENALGHGLHWSLVSRRSVKRAGTRFLCRGIDHNGNVANFVETEQVLDRAPSTVLSFVQIRGSIPLFWSQTPGYKYKPPIEIHQENHEAALEKHINELQTLYGQITMACLIDQRGHEGRLAHEFAEKINQIQKYYNVQYHYFDFHKECSKMRWHRLSILLERLEEEIQAYGYFEVESGKVTRKQTGVIRSNCIDSLDRTNVIQSMIAQYVLQTQLGIFSASYGAIKLADFPIFMDTFKNVWADHADAISIQYAGTPALKTDFTRTGQRTHMGLLKDGFNSLTRYVYNNYLDTYRQDAIDLFLGNYNGYPSPMYRPLAITTYTSALPVTIVMLTLVAMFLYFRWDPMRY